MQQNTLPSSSVVAESVLERLPSPALVLAEIEQLYCVNGSRFCKVPVVLEPSLMMKGGSMPDVELQYIV